MEKNINKWNALFTGQGAQFSEMFSPFLSNNDSKQILRKSSDILGYDVLKIVADKQKINQTQYTQPLNYIYQYMVYKRYLENVSIAPDTMIGHSMGEFIALTCSGAIRFTDGLKLIEY